MPRGRGPRRQVPLHDVCGSTQRGVLAYSNGSSNTFTAVKNYVDGIFMGYQWQCVEFARRWLWLEKGLLLPERPCAFFLSGVKSVRRLKSPPPPRAIDGADDAVEVKKYTKDDWERVPCCFVKQGSHQPPVSDSLIIYPMSYGSPWGHVGVITEVDMEKSLVYVADQNRYFHEWNDKTHSAVFPLECVKGRYYIRDHESECKGWLTFPDTTTE